MSKTTIIAFLVVALAAPALHADPEIPGAGFTNFALEKTVSATVNGSIGNAFLSRNATWTTLVMQKFNSKRGGLVTAFK